MKEYVAEKEDTVQKTSGECSLNENCDMKRNMARGKAGNVNK